MLHPRERPFHINDETMRFLSKRVLDIIYGSMNQSRREELHGRIGTYQEPVDLICVLLAPETAGADHLKALARISRLLRDQGVCEKLRGTDDAEAIHAVLSNFAKSHAA